MKGLKHFLLIASMLVPTLALAQGGTQRGYVKTLGRNGSNGSVTAGKRLPGVTISLDVVSNVRSADNGGFSFKLPSNKNTYVLKGASKGNTYQLIAPDLNKERTCSSNPLEIIMVDKNEQANYQKQLENKLRQTLNAQIRKQQNEIQNLKDALTTLRKAKTISEQEYQQKISELELRNEDLVKQQENSEEGIRKLAEEYANKDYDHTDELNRLIDDCRLNGRFEELDSLIATKGDFNERLMKIRQEQALEAQRDEEIRKQQEINNQAKAGTQASLQDLAQDAYYRYESCLFKGDQDSAYYYIKFRADLDSTNIQWQFDATVANINYYDRALREARKQYEPNSIELAQCLDRIGKYYAEHNYHMSYLAEDFLQEAKDILESVVKSSEDNNQAISELAYNHLYWGDLYSSQSRAVGDSIELSYCDSLTDKHYKSALELFMELYGTNHPDVALCYVHMGLHNSDSLLFEKALEIYKSLYGENHPSIAECYFYMACSYYSDTYIWTPRNPIGVGYELIEPDLYSEHEACEKQIEDYKRSLQYYEKARQVYIQLYGENYTKVKDIEFTQEQVKGDIATFEHALGFNSPVFYLMQKHHGLSDEEIKEMEEEEEE